MLEVVHEGSMVNPGENNKNKLVCLLAIIQVNIHSC